MKNRKKQVRPTRNTGQKEIVHESLKPVEKFLAQDALHHFAIIYLHDAAYQVKNQVERAAFIECLAKEPASVRNAFVHFAEGFRSCSSVSNIRQKDRLSSYITFCRRALDYDSSCCESQSVDADFVDVSDTGKTSPHR